MTSEESQRQEELTWEDYYEALEGREPHPLFVVALARFDAEITIAAGLYAIDLGCGDGTETVTLLEAGWNVLAVDSEPAAIGHVRSKVRARFQHLLEVRVASFEDFDLPETDFVYAGYSLPFCKPERFDSLWVRISTCIRPGGRFAGQLFGIRDTWADEPDMTFHSAEQVNHLLEHGFEVERMREIEEDGRAVSGPKHWHIFEIIARKLDKGEFAP